MVRTTLVWLVALAALVATTALATMPLPIEEYDPCSAPCNLSVTENAGTRYCTWSAVGGASYYKVGRVDEPGGDAEVFAQTSGTTAEDQAFDPSVCYMYVMVAYDGNGDKVCSAKVENVGNCSTN